MIAASYFRLASKGEYGRECTAVKTRLSCLVFLASISTALWATE